MADILWMIAVSAGPLVLAVAIAYGLLTRRRLTPQERNLQAEATERAFRDEPPPRQSGARTPRS